MLLAAMLYCGVAFVASCSTDDITPQEQFEKEMTEALADAREYGPHTQAFAVEIANRHQGLVTDINYKTRESATRKCRTDNCMPYDLKDLARTTIVAGWKKQEVEPVIEDLNKTATERGFFGRYKHQTSDYGYWGDITNLQYNKLMTEIQVKTYGMFYAAQEEEIARSVLGEKIYNFIHTNSGVEPGLSHIYYEIMRADTSSAATVEKYKQLAIQYHECFEHLPDYEEPAK